ncbi:MAG: methionyl-tRNA formyltransferase [Bacilli bacterium]
MKNIKDLKVVFMGTPDFALNVLQILIDNCNVIGVVSQPDKLVGRKKILTKPPIKILAEKYNIPVFQPKKIKEEYQDILDLNPDIIVTCAYGQIIPKILLDYPKYKCINVHASLLPKLRGGAPIHKAIIDGYEETGVTIMYMDEKMDSGDIISQEKITIKDTDTVGILWDKLSVMGAELLLKTLPDIINDNINRIKQNEDEVTYAYNIQREEEKIDFSKTTKEVFNRIRGLNPYPGAYAKLNNKIVKIYDVEYTKNIHPDKQIGQIIKADKNGIIVSLKDGELIIKSLQMEGKKKTTVKEFVNGNIKIENEVLE